MTTTPDIAAIAAGLTKAQREALALMPCWGFPAGHNQWFDVEYMRAGDPDTTACSGDDMNAMLRSGLVTAGDRDEEGGVHLIDGDRECEARWPLDLTPAGLSVRQFLLEGEGAKA